MGVSRNLLALIITLVLAFVIGALYTPPPAEHRFHIQEREFDGIAQLPALPGWSTNALPDFSQYSDVQTKKDAFFSFLYPRIVLANTRVLALRHHLMTLDNKAPLTADDEAWLTRQAKRLRIDTELAPEAMILELREHLDVIPPSLVMAQAANESAWGTSRFARKGNNLFGQWCFSVGCGIVPAKRSAGASHEVASFSSPYHSVRAYIENLNRHDAYQGLRDVRLAARRRGYFPNGVGLATGLESYSERGHAYVEEIQSMIRYNKLTRYDDRYQTLLDRGNLALKDVLTGSETLAMGDQAKREG
ncbi:bax protein [Tamilnaduibacter salinus]|uniref:Bax protein n=1 Tax=Tamilnaduibacter salinus TaxID=1484056 RepID=A0A2A2I2E7_9GAMM|nr:glucosaminidase domain-containing protein [Tamilnaduibacter salinus]PAV25598.1 bax protein [Tamilnaduibacter salinus]